MTHQNANNSIFTGFKARIVKNFASQPDLKGKKWAKF
jgi:hypothetical protein